MTTTPPPDHPPASDRPQPFAAASPTPFPPARTRNAKVLGLIAAVIVVAVVLFQVTKGGGSHTASDTTMCQDLNAFTTQTDDLPDPPTKAAYQDLVRSARHLADEAPKDLQHATSMLVKATESLAATGSAPVDDPEMTSADEQFATWIDQHC